MAWGRLTSKGTFERRPPLDPTPSPPLLASVFLSLPRLCLTSAPLSSPLCSRHTGLLAVPQTCQARPYLRTFPLSVPSARNPLPPDLRVARVLTSFRSLLQCSLPREALPQASISHSAGHPTPLALPQVLPGAHHNMASLSVCRLVLSVTRKHHKDRNCVLFTILWC